MLDAQDASVLPIWRPKIVLDCPYHDLGEQEIYDLLELYSYCLMGKSAVSGAKIRTAENAENTQKNSYQLGILTLPWTYQPSAVYRR